MKYFALSPARGMGIVVATFLLASAFAEAQTQAATTPASVNKIPFAGASPEIREFLTKAEVADRIADPLARCLAFPDLPGNKWPRGLTKAHCEYLQGPHITLAIASDHLQRGDLSRLEALFAADLERHFSKDNFSEIIHRDFHAFDTSKESDQFTAAWLAKSPKSAYALAARAFYYRELSRAARGTRYASDTPDENVEKMGKFVSLATDHFEQALAIEPRLIPAYAALISMGTMDSRLDLKRNAIRKAKELDPFCSVAIDFEMGSLTPRWGGNYEAMTKLSAEISPAIEQRPLLANSAILHYADLGNALYIEKNYKDAIEVLQQTPPFTTHAGTYQDLARSMYAINAGHFETLMYFLVAARFEEQNAFANRTIGMMLLMDARKPLWAKKYLVRAIEQSPDDVFAHYYLGKADLHNGNLQEAETHLLISSKDEKTRRDSLLDLSAVYMRLKQAEKAHVQIQMLNKEFPKFAPGWIYASGILRALNKPGVDDALKKFLETANRNDPFELSQIEGVERELKSRNP